MPSLIADPYAGKYTGLYRNQLWMRAMVFNNKLAAKSFLTNVRLFGQDDKEKAIENKSD